MPKNRILYLTIVAVFLGVTGLVQAQFPYSESFKNTTSSGLVVSGAAKLTAAAGIDAPGQGYLRLTENVTNSVGYVYAQDSFPSKYGITASFEFFTWKPNANNSNQADGICFFLFDASVNAFRPGGIGGSLGYAQYYATPGLAKGYIGVAIDEFGNFSNAGDGGKSGGTAVKNPGSVVIRGPGNGRTASDYVYRTHVVTGNTTYNIPFSGIGFTQRFPDPASANYRKLKIILTPGSSLGATIGYKVSVIMYKGGPSLTAVTLVDNVDYPYAAPDKLQFGLTSSTGGVTSYHEIRNMTIDATNTGALVAPTLVNDAVTIACQGQQALIDVAINDISNNTSGAISKETVDLDPATAGQQTTYTDAGKGTYTVDATGIVAFTPSSGFSGTSVISYNVDDTYGITASTSGTITVNVNAATGPSLTIVNPSGACAPQQIDITSAAYKSNTTAGATYSYFKNLTDANNNTNNINTTASTINQSGTYYIRALYNSCPTVKPIVVQISTAPTTSNAGADQVSCTFDTLQTTLLGSYPEVGEGTWSLVSGPATAVIAYPNAATSPLSIKEKGAYTFRWTIANGVCAASIDDVLISVGTVVSDAGSSQVLCNSTTATLQGNTPVTGSGLWSKISGPVATITAPSNPASTITGLTPGNSYVFSWRITNGACISTSQVTITSNIAPVANAGSNQSFANTTTATLNATPPAIGSGLWTQVSGPATVISAPASAGSAITGLIPGNTYVFRWTVTNGACVSYSDVTLTNVLNTPADAGVDQAVGNVNQFVLTGNTPGSGNIGTWTLQSAPSGNTVVINQPNSPITTVSSINKTGDYVFRWTITTGSFLNTDDTKVSVSSVLPVTFISFTGRQEGDKVALTWQTADERANHHFVIERSADGIHFIKVGSVVADSSASLLHQYHFDDPVNELTVPVVYYRLLQADVDGTASYSTILKITLQHLKSVQVWPNPFRNKIHITAYLNSAGTAHISLYNYAGILLRQQQQYVTKGWNSFLLQQLYNINTRFLILEVVKDEIIYRQKLIKE